MKDLIALNIGIFTIILARLALFIYGFYSTYMLYHLASTIGITTADWIWYGFFIFLAFGSLLFRR